MDPGIKNNPKKVNISKSSYGIDKKRDLGVFIFSRIIVSISIAVILFPILYIFSISLRTKETIYKDFLYLIPKAVTFQNYIDAFNYARDHLDVTFFEMFRNSIICTVSAIIVAIIIAALASYSFSNYKFKGKEVTFTMIIASFVIPAQVLLIPLFFILRNLKILNTYLAIIIPYVGFLIPIATLILRSFFEQIPLEIKESAKIDGATDFGVFIKIILPLSKSAIATCIILLFLETWNEFIFALVFLQNPKFQTIPVAIAKIAGSKYIIPLGTYGASIMITIIPVLIIFIIFQRWFIAGITMGSIKG
ncbi:MAG: carbohydrate ABC transporter permease [Actinobacteria bacterium]|nr:carbohydrate ABC transporter permease [Actinomycetota bacterium]